MERRIPFTRQIMEVNKMMPARIFIRKHPFFFILIGILMLLFAFPFLAGAQNQDTIGLGLSAEDYLPGKIPKGWTIRKKLGFLRGAKAEWVIEEGVHAVKLHSKATLTFLEKIVDIDIREFPIVTWQWKVENILQNIDERTVEGDDHPIRIFFVFEPDASHSHLQPGDIIKDPGKPMQKLMVIEGGNRNLGRWLTYKRNLYEDYTMLYGEEPRRLIFIGILNDTDKTGQEAVSYIAGLQFHRKEKQLH